MSIPAQMPKSAKWNVESFFHWTKGRLGCRSLPAVVALSATLAMSGTASAITLYYNAPTPPLNAWTTVTAPLTEAGWVVDDWDGGVAATQAQSQWVLGHLEALYVLTEWRTGPDDTHVDNVIFGGAASSSFAASAEGWLVAGPVPESDIVDQIVSTSPLGHDAGFGNPVGAVNVADVFFWTWIAAPAAYLGDHSSEYGNNLSADLFIRFTDGIPYPAFALVAPDQPANNVPEPWTTMLIVTGFVAAGITRRRWSIR